MRDIHVFAFTPGDAVLSVQTRYMRLVPWHMPRPLRPKGGEIVSSDAKLESDAESPANIFISYSRKDASFVDHLEASLIERGFSPKIDRSDIYAFEDWWKRIEDLIVKADTIVFVLSPDALSSDICRKEVEFAAALKKRFAPIVFRQVDAKTVPDELARLNFIFFDDEAGFEESADKLAEALSTNIDWIRKHTEFGEFALRWSQAGPPGAKRFVIAPPSFGRG